MGNKNFDWCYHSEPEAGLGYRTMTYPRGKVLGGSSSINAMCFTRGHARDFDRWAGNGLPEWSYAHCLPYFRKMETYSGGADAYRGGDGPLNVTSPRYTSPLCAVFLEACEQAGHVRNDNINGRVHSGFGASDQTIHQGRRVSTARAYLEPVRNRKNLTVRTECLTHRVLFERDRAVGIEYSRAGRTEVVNAEREVILCSGALNSPKLLMLSGIGDESELSQHGISVVSHLPAVGKNLQDHLDIYIQRECPEPVTMTPALKFPRKAFIGLRWLLNQRGEGATNHFEAGGALSTNDNIDQPDLMIWFCPMAVNADGTPTNVAHGYQLMVMQLRPKSRGTVSLRSNAPADAPVIHSNFLKETDDKESLREGVRRGRDILRQAAFEPFRGAEISPGEHVQSDAQIDEFVRQKAKSTRHPSCTCAMGTDEETSVVDGEGRVHGVESLRVIDASVMPTIPSAALNAPTIMLAEKLADRVIGNQPLASMMAEAAAVSR